MKNRLKKFSLKVLGFEFSEGRKLIADLKQNRARRYPLSGGGRSYPVVTIGTQVWLAENLDYKFVSVNPGGIPTTPAAWYYNNDEATYGIDGTRKCGLLYNWYAAKYLNDNRQTLCPGWHVPTLDEWNALATAVGGTTTGGTKLKAANLDWATGWNGTDDYGFAAMPAGYCEGSSYSGITTVCGFWTITESDSTHAHQMGISTGPVITDINDGKKYGYSIRLVKD